MTSNGELRSSTGPIIPPQPSQAMISNNNQSPNVSMQNSPYARFDYDKQHQDMVELTKKVDSQAQAITQMANQMNETLKILNKWQNDRIAFRETPTIKMDTRDRTNYGDSPVNCTMAMTVPGKTPGIKNLVLCGYSIPHKFKNINQYTNTFAYSETHSSGFGLNLTVPVAIANVTTITWPAPHGFTSNQYVYVTGSTSTPSINNRQQITVVTATTFTIAVNVTVAGVADFNHLITGITTGAVMTTSTPHGLQVNDGLFITTTDGTVLTNAFCTVSAVGSPTTATLSGQTFSSAVLGTNNNNYIVSRKRAYVLTLTQGNYDSNGVGTLLQTAMRAVSYFGNEVVTAPSNSNGNVYTIALGNIDQTITLNMGTLANPTTTIYRILGFSAQYATVAQSISGDRGYMVNGITEIDIHISTYHNGISSESINSQFGIFWTHNITTAYNDMMTFNPPRTPMSLSNFFTSIQVRLSCRFLFAVDLPMTEDWSMWFKEEPL